MQGRGMLKKPPRVRDNNGALQVRLRLGGRDHFINRIGRFDAPVAQAMQIDITLCQNLLALSVLEFICRPAEVEGYFIPCINRRSSGVGSPFAYFVNGAEGRLLTLEQ